MSPLPTLEDVFKFHKVDLGRDNLPHKGRENNPVQIPQGRFGTITITFIYRSQFHVQIPQGRFGTVYYDEDAQALTFVQIPQGRFGTIEVLRGDAPIPAKGSNSTR